MHFLNNAGACSSLRRSRGKILVAMDTISGVCGCSSKILLIGAGKMGTALLNAHGSIKAQCRSR